MPTLRALVQKAKPEVTITLKSGDTSSGKIYSTFDKIEGTVTITVAHDTRFDSIDIDFIGTARSYVERLATTSASVSKTEAFHKFLRLSQPIAPSSLPANSVFQAGVKYDFDFLFVVPQRGLPRVCRHKVDNPAVRDAHLQLPPTLGGEDTQLYMPDDYAPDMSIIRYSIVGKITEAAENGDKRPSTVKTKDVRIIPARDEAPPLTTDGPQSEYIMRTEKTLRKGVFKGKLGSLVMEVAQPKSLRLPSPGSDDDSPISTMATVMLRFDPAESRSQPPRLGSLGSKIKIQTYFASAARQNFAVKTNIQWDAHQGLRSESLHLASRCVAGVEWHFHQSEASERLQRRDSALSTSSQGKHPTPSPSQQYQGNGFYTAQILVPITLPENKTWVPTFHSCLISRVYSVNLNLGIHSVGLGPSMELKVPIQISSQGSSDQQAQHRASLTSEEAVAEAREADEFFGATNFNPMVEQFGDRHNTGGAAPELPPQYEALVQASRSVPVF